MTGNAKAAHLDVDDVAASIDWFRHTLGFDLEACEGSPPHHAALRRATTCIILRRLSPTLLQSEAAARQAPSAAAIEVDRLETLRELYERARITGAFISRKIEPKPWGAWVFLMRDLDGNLLLLSAPQAVKPD
jgi:uncharacterized glyoxalase superfamily protein PhnB